MRAAADTLPIRPARGADAEALASVEARAWRAAYTHLLPSAMLERFLPERLVDRWRFRIAGGDPILVAAVRDRVAAYATFGPARDAALDPGFAGEVYELYVDPDHQRLGLGRALLASARAELSQRYAWLVVEVLRDNRPARAFYEATGLTTEGRSLARPLGGLSAHRGRRYSLPHSAVVVVRYEGPLVDLSW